MRDKGRGFFSKRMISSLAVVCFGVLLYMALSNFGAVTGAVGWFFSIFQPFVVGLCIAYLLNMPMRFFEDKLFKRFRKKRALAILTTYLLAVLVLAVLIGLILPQLFDSVARLLSSVGLYLSNLNSLVSSIGQRFDIAPESIDTFLLSYNDIVNSLVGMLRSALPDILNVGMRIGSGLIGALTALIASIYMLFGKEKLLRQSRRVLYAVVPQKTANETMRIGKMANGVFSGFIGGKLLDSLIIGIICFVFMSVMNILYSILGVEAIRMPYAPLISVIIGVTNIIPFFGPFIGAIPSVMILLMVNPWSGLWFTVFIIVLQQFDGNVLGPKILGDSTGLPAMWVLIAIIVGGGLFGFTGMLLGVPTTAVLYTLASDLIEGRLRRNGLAEAPELVNARSAGAAEAKAEPPPAKPEGEDPQSNG